MATQVPATPEMDTAMQAAEASLTAGLRALSNPGTTPAASTSTPAPTPAPVAEPAPSPAPTSPTPTPAPVAATPATPPAPAAPPASGTPSPEAPPDIASLFQSPEAKYFLSLHGGNVEKALAAAAGYNNRLSALSKKYPQEFASGGVADPKAPVPAPNATVPVPTPEPSAAPAPVPTPTPPAGSTAAAGTAPAPEVQLAPALAVPPEQLIDWSKVHADTTSLVDQDRECIGYVRTWVESDEGVKQLSANISKTEGEIAYIQRQLADTRLSLTEQERGDREDQLRVLRSELTMNKFERTNLQNQARQVEQAFNARQRAIYDHVASRHYGQAQEQVSREEDRATEAQATQELVSAWAPAVTRVASSHSIPADMIEDFRSEAKRSLQARWAEDPNFVVDTANLDAFLTPIAASFMSRMDRYHRSQSAVYAALAAQRAAAPSPAPSAPVAAPVSAPPSGPVDLEAIMESASREVSQKLRGR